MLVYFNANTNFKDFTHTKNGKSGVKGKVSNRMSRK